MTQSTEGLEDLPRMEYKISSDTTERERGQGFSFASSEQIEFSKITYNACVSVFILVS